VNLELARDDHARAVASIDRYCREQLEAPLSNLAATALLDYVLREIAPLAYNAAVRDVQKRMLARVSELDSEVYADEFSYWRRADSGKRQR